jgi:hypothetical protein
VECETECNSKLLLTPLQSDGCTSALAIFCNFLWKARLIVPAPGISSYRGSYGISKAEIPETLGTVNVLIVYDKHLLIKTLKEQQRTYWLAQDKKLILENYLHSHPMFYVKEVIMVQMTKHESQYARSAR